MGKSQSLQNKNVMDLKTIECILFSKVEREGKEILEEKPFHCLMYDKENPQFILMDNNNDLTKLTKALGFSKYKFRKGIGLQGKIQRLYFKGITKNGVEFYRYKKENRKLTVDKTSILKVPIKELKYIYPYILSPNITENKLEWSKTYVIFPYEYGEKQPVEDIKLKNEAPTLYNYLASYKSELEKESDYNKRIQHKNKYYGVIRVGKYTYQKCFVAIRDNTKLVAQVIGEIKTDWGELKIPLFDNHISYLSEDLNGLPLDCEKANAIKKVLNNKTIRQFIEGYYDSRSIGSRLPIRIEELLNEF